MTTVLKSPIHPLIGNIESRMRAQFSGHPPLLVDSLEELMQIAEIHLRPTILFLMGGMFDAGKEELLNLAAAVEMLHTATLVHDDLIDETSRQRGQQTVNARFSTSVTVLTGDLAFAAASQLAAATNSVPVMEKISETLQFIVNGKITQMFKEVTSSDQETYFAWIHSKTASVFELASGLAATLGSANPDEVEAAYQFGYNIGMANQIIDDTLKFIGDPSIIVKSFGKNFLRGTLTLPTLLYLESHPGEFDIGSIIKNNGNGRVHLEAVIRAIRQSDAIDRAMQEAEDFLLQSKIALSRLPECMERTELAQLSRQIISRER